MSNQSVLDSVRQPEYTGENRCIPCTVVNLVIAAVVCAVLAFLWWPAAVAFAVVALASIALRGYLVPGTPTLTRRYLPDRVLALFDKGPTSSIDGKPMTPIDEEQRVSVEEEELDTAPLDTERQLLTAGVVEPCADVDDLCLAPDFHEAWNSHMGDIEATDAQREALADALDADGDIEFDEHGDAFAAHLDGQAVGQWESRAALIADLAAARELPNWFDDWESFDPTEQGTIIRGLRVFVETCPTCGGPVLPSEETVSSCCREHTVVAIACEDCGARLFETLADTIPTEDGPVESVNS